MAATQGTKPNEEEDQAFCQNCGSGRDFSQAQYDRYFRAEPLVCDVCKAPIGDWWVAVRQTIEGRDAWRTVKALGYNICMFTIDLRPRQTTTLDLTQRGVPADARILFIKPQVNGFLIPVEADFDALWESTAKNIRAADGTYPVAPIRSSLPKRLKLPHTLSFYAAEYGAGPHEPCSAQIAVSWLEPDVNEVAAESLSDAFDALSVERDQASLLPANTAVEMKYQNLLAKTLRSRLAGTVSSDDDAHTLVKAFMGGRAVDVVRQTKLLLQAGGAPPLSPQVEAMLNKLRAVRNNVAHKGQAQSQLPLRTVAEYLCSAVFLVHYLNFAEPYLKAD